LQNVLFCVLIFKSNDAMMDAPNAQDYHGKRNIVLAFRKWRQARRFGIVVVIVAVVLTTRSCRRRLDTPKRSVPSPSPGRVTKGTRPRAFHAPQQEAIVVVVVVIALPPDGGRRKMSQQPAGVLFAISH
jgi:hypothetical protein